MAVRRALVVIGGQVQQLPVGDTLTGATGGASFSSSNIVSTDTVVADGESAYRSDYLEIAAGVELAIGVDSVVEVG